MIDTKNLGSVLHDRFPQDFKEGRIVVRQDGDGDPFIAHWDAIAVGVSEPDKATLALWEAEWLGEETAEKPFRDLTMAQALAFVQGLSNAERNRLLTLMMVRHVQQHPKDARRAKEGL